MTDHRQQARPVSLGPDPRPKARFKLFRQFNAPGMRGGSASRGYVNDTNVRHFARDSLQDRFVRALAADRGLRFKEVLEAGEFMQRSRRWVSAPVVADLCCGHGLAGVLLAMFDRRVERVVLIDRSRPPSHDRVMAAAVQVAPWVEEKVEYVTADIARATDHLPQGAGIMAVHACGPRTDRSIDIALELGGPLALLPCCRSKAGSPAPRSLVDAIGTDMATDIHRTYRLEEAGYQTRWDRIPETITPEDRMLLAKPMATE